MTTFVKMTVDSVDYYLSDESYAGENYWNPFILSPPTLDLKGEGWIKCEAGSMVLINEPFNTKHPFSYSNGDFATLLSTPEKEYDVAINFDNESTSQHEVLWSGKAVLESISNETLSFNLFNRQPEIGTIQYLTIGRWPVYWVSKGNPVSVLLYVRSSGTSGAPSVIKEGDRLHMYPQWGDSSTLEPSTPSFWYWSGLARTDAVYSTSSPYTLWEVYLDIDRSAASTAEFCTIVTSPNTSGTSPVWWLYKIIDKEVAYLSPGHYPREVDSQGRYATSYDGYDYVTGDVAAYASSNYKLYQDGVEQSVTKNGYQYRITSGAVWSGVVTYQYPDGSPQYTINDTVDAQVSETMNITKAPNADSDAVATVDFVKKGHELAYETIDWICRNTNYQFFDEYANSSDTYKTLYLIDKANTPSTTEINSSEIISVNYIVGYPLRSVSCKVKRNSEEGSASDNNYAIVVTESELRVFNDNTSNGRDKSVDQISDNLEKQKQYLDAILASNSKPVISVTLDSINTTIRPGDNLTFTERQAPVTVSSLLVRQIRYNLGNAQTTFVGDGVITVLEKT